MKNIFITTYKKGKIFWKISFLFLGIFFMILAYFNHKHLSIIKNYPETKAYLVTSDSSLTTQEQSEYYNESSQYNDSSNYLIYQYEVDGINYDFRVNSNTKFFENSVLKIKYNPDNPKEISYNHLSTVLLLLLGLQFFSFIFFPVGFWGWGGELYIILGLSYYKTFGPIITIICVILGIKLLIMDQKINKQKRVNVFKKIILEVQYVQAKRYKNSYTILFCDYNKKYNSMYSQNLKYFIYESTQELKPGSKYEIELYKYGTNFIYQKFDNLYNARVLSNFNDNDFKKV